VLGCATAATVFELSGPMVGWLGWPVAAVMAWVGWLLAAAVIVLRGRHRMGGVVLLAGVAACVVYGGQPDTMALLALAFVVFVAAYLVLRAVGQGDSGPIVRPLLDMVVAGICGAALAAPLLLPALQLTRASVRGAKGGSQVLPLSDLVHVVVQGYDGLPVAGSHWFGGVFYVRTAAYVGVVGVVLAAVGVLAAVRQRRHRPELVAVGAVALVTASVVFVGPAVSIMDALPSVGPVTWNRSLLPLAFALAVLAGAGADLVARSWGDRTVRRVAQGGFALLGLILLLVWGVGRGHLPGPEASIRARSLFWPGVVAAGGAVVTAVMGALQARRTARAGGDGGGSGLGRGLALVLVAVETVMLVVAGAPLPSSSPVPLSPTPAERTLARLVGTSLVGFGNNACFSADQLGIVPDVNVAFGVHELAVYDPLFPQAYYDTWLQATGETGEPERLAAVPFSLFCPAVTSAVVARRYGIGFVLEPSGGHGPPGTVLVADVGHERLYRVPGVAAATLVPAPGTGPEPGPDAVGSAVAVSHPGPASWRVVTRTSGPALLRLRLSDVPGWHATIDGRPLALERYAGVLLEARVPSGRHTVVLSYWPSRFTAGLGLAGAAVVGLIAVPLVATARRRRRSRPVPGRGRTVPLSAPG
jgi:hypothetical protein